MNFKENKKLSVIEFHPKIEKSTTVGHNKLKYWIEELKGWLGTILKKLQICGFIQEVSFFDEVTRQQISVKINRRFTVVSVGGRDYYFKRLTGKFDGTGYQNPCI